MHRQSAGPASDVRIIDPKTGKVTARIKKRPGQKTMHVASTNSLPRRP